jgi:hypothetical protein
MAIPRPDGVVASYGPQFYFSPFDTDVEANTKCLIPDTVASQFLLSDKLTKERYLQNSKIFETSLNVKQIVLRILLASYNTIRSTHEI